MRTLHLSQMTLQVDFSAGHISSLVIKGKERLTNSTPLFRIRFRDRKGHTLYTDAHDATICELTEDGAIYCDFKGAEQPSPTVQIHLADVDGRAEWRISVSLDSNDHFVEWVDFPLVTLPALSANNEKGNGGKILLPYNEGVLISDEAARQMTDFRHWDPEYPSLGCYPLFPNMICSQMLAYLWDDAGLYLGAHDPHRGVKSIDFFGADGGKGNVTMLMRLFCGVDFGETFTMDYPIVWAVTEPRWESAAEIYREWFESTLPPRVRKIRDNRDLPEWYEDNPLVVSYPVRGIHDTDDMTPNALFPYTNALPLLDEIRRATDSRLLVLLMHWEGTAPWAPPYVWPPYGGEENFNSFMKTLHEKKDLLGVYCSGFGYTVQSKLVADYNCQKEYDENTLWRGMCVGPDGKVAISKICTAQRSGYDVCPASEVGHKLLGEAYCPLFESGVDYAQILDQNHGGGQYFCYSRDHGHPPAPGAWMTKHMQEMLSEWNQKAPHMLFGCESAAAEPFMGNLQFSDNRFELNYFIGTPVPLYAYLYHEYLRNFMGNQVCAPFDESLDTLAYRMAYSFSCGDCLTLVLTPDGNIMDHWGTRDFEHCPDKDVIFRLIANLTRFYREVGKPYLHAGRMIPALPVECDSVTYGGKYLPRAATLPSILSTAWEAEDGRRAQILVNPETTDLVCKVGDREITVPALDAILISL